MHLNAHRCFLLSQCQGLVLFFIRYVRNHASFLLDKFQMLRSESAGLEKLIYGALQFEGCCIWECLPFLFQALPFGSHSMKLSWPSSANSPLPLTLLFSRVFILGSLLSSIHIYSPSNLSILVLTYRLMIVELLPSAQTSALTVWSVHLSRSSYSFLPACAMSSSDPASSKPHSPFTPQPALPLSADLICSPAPLPFTRSHHWNSRSMTKST